MDTVNMVDSLESLFCTSYYAKCPGNKNEEYRVPTTQAFLVEATEWQSQESGIIKVGYNKSS